MPHRLFGLIAVACSATAPAGADLDESQVTATHFAVQVANDIATVVERAAERNCLP
jgi:hypothetical protein